MAFASGSTAQLNTAMNSSIRSRERGGHLGQEARAPMLFHTST
jgi:hypothetical protein